MREETILNYQNLVYKILSHYRNLYNYNRDFEEDYFHDGMVALIQAYDTYKDDNNVKFITYASRCIHNKYKDIFKKKSFNEEPLDLQIKDDLYLLDIIPSKEEKILDMLIKKETKEELFNLRFQQATGNLEKPSRIRDLRHTVARLKTVLKERETVEKEG